MATNPFPATLTPTLLEAYRQSASVGETPQLAPRRAEAQPANPRNLRAIAVSACLVADIPQGYRDTAAYAARCFGLVALIAYLADLSRLLPWTPGLEELQLCATELAREAAPAAPILAKRLTNQQP